MSNLSKKNNISNKSTSKNNKNNKNNNTDEKWQCIVDCKGKPPTKEQAYRKQELPVDFLLDCISVLLIEEYLSCKKLRKKLTDNRDKLSLIDDLADNLNKRLSKEGKLKLFDISIDKKTTHLFFTLFPNFTIPYRYKIHGYISKLLKNNIARADYYVVLSDKCVFRISGKVARIMCNKNPSILDLQNAYTPNKKPKLKNFMTINQYKEFTKNY